MAIKSKDEMPHRPIEIDLTGPEGNVFYLMGCARKWSRQLWERGEFTQEAESDMSFNRAMNFVFETNFETPESMGEYICQKMMESDYENALKVFDFYFGSFVIMYR